jgi:Icc protein
VKLGLIADIHAGPDADTQLGSHAPALLESFCAAMQAFRPDLIVDLGDRINSVSAVEDRERLTWIRRVLTQIGVPVFHVFGNTDGGHLAKAESMSLVGQREAYQCIDGWDQRIALLDSQDPPVEGVGGEIGPGQAAWLTRTLEGSAKTGLIFCHHPLDDQDLGGHRYFALRPDLAQVRNRVEIRPLVERGSRVIGAFAGHLHWTRVSMINGIPYVTLGSLVDCAYTAGRPAGTFATVAVRTGVIDVRVEGLRPGHFEFTR